MRKSPRDDCTPVCVTEAKEFTGGIKVRSADDSQEAPASPGIVLFFLDTMACLCYGTLVCDENRALGEFSSVGRVLASQAGCRGSESRNSL